MKYQLIFVWCLAASAVYVAESTAIDSNCDAMDDFCGEHDDQVCGNDGQTYSTWCALYKKACIDGSRLVEEHAGPCHGNEEASVVSAASANDCDSMDEFCGENDPQVCGSDGQTYANFCVLFKKACTDESHLTEAHDGAC